MAKEKSNNWWLVLGIMACVLIVFFLFKFFTFDLEDCDLIEDTLFKVDCYAKYAVSKDNAKYCDLLENEFEMILCYEQHGLLTGTKEACALVLDQEEQEKCYLNSYLSQGKESFYDCSKNTYDCVNFSSQFDAQMVFELCGGVSNDVHNLDGDGDGKACEWNP